MPNIDITQPELVWPGKYDEHGHRVVNRGVALPFQVVETINLFSSVGSLEMGANSALARV